VAVAYYSLHKSAARQLLLLTEVIHIVAFDKWTQRPAKTMMEFKFMRTFTHSGGSGRWIVAPGTHVAITFLGHYYPRWGVISKVLCRDPLLVEVKVFEVSPVIEVDIPFPIGDLQYISPCAGRDVIWEVEHLRPYVGLPEDPLEAVGGLSTPVLEDVKSVEKFLSLAKGMVVALVNTKAPSHRCAGIGIIEEYSPKGVWSGFLIPHSFFVIVRVQVVNSKYKNHAIHCEFPIVQTLGCVVGHRILRSGYKVRPIDADCISP
jgi:hypothetical protein